MSQALVTPDTENLSDVGVDHVCRVIRSDLAALGWIGTNSLGRIYPQRDENGNVEPWIHKAGEEYYPAYPNDELDTFSALYPHDDEQVSGFGYLGKRSLSVIVWVNLDALGVSEPTIEQLKHQIIVRLRELVCVSEVHHCYDQSTSGSEGIYPGFGLNGLQDRFNTYPYRAFRIETTVNYYIQC